MSATLPSTSLVSPHNVDAEKSVLGSILLDAGVLLDVLDLLKPRDFYVTSNGEIFAAMVEMFRKRLPVDLLTLTNYLQERKQLTEIGGASALAELTEFVPTASHAKEYAKIVRSKAVKRRVMEACSQTMARAQDDLMEDTELVAFAQKALLDITDSMQTREVVTARELADQFYEEYAAVKEGDAQFHAGIPTGSARLNAVISGLKAPDLFVLAARPGQGKTSMALNWAIAAGVAGNKVQFVSLEMSPEQLHARAVSSLSGVEQWKIRCGNTTADEDERVITANDAISNITFDVMKGSARSILDLAAVLTRQKLRGRCDLIIVDYLQLVRGMDMRNRTNEVGEVSRGLKSLAMSLNVPVVALAQLNRESEKRVGDARRPNLSDLRESGSIEADADIVAFIHRDPTLPEYDRTVELIIRKHRNGPTGDVKMHFNPKTTTFTDIETFPAAA